jgi:hypothetical protein
LNPIAGTISPKEIAERFFGKAFDSLGKDKQFADKKIPIAEVPIIEESINKDVGKWKNIDSQVRDDLEKVFNREAYPKLKGLVLTHSTDGVSYLNLAVQAQIKDLGGYPIAPVDLAALAELIILLNLSNDESEDTNLTFTPGLTLPGTGFILSRIHEHAKRFSSEISLKTLPFFHLSNYSDINKKCLFFSKRLSIAGRDLPVVFDFFSGEYMITGFKHVITTSECYSEFLLTKFGASDDVTVKRKLLTSDDVTKKSLKDNYVAPTIGNKVIY